MNKNIKKIGTMVLVAVVAVGTYFVSGTYAKYTSHVTGTDTAKVAKWAWEINDDALANNTTIYTLDLFRTAVKDSNGTDTETDMASTTHMVAPGTSGSFQIKVENLSEVDANYSVDFTEIKGSAVSDAAIEYSLNGSTYAGINSLDQAVEELVNTNGTKTITVYWRWLYQVNEGTEAEPVYTNRDDADTAVGFAAANAATDADRTITITADVTLTQVD